MGKYKDEHGTSRLGDLLRSVGKSDLITTAASLVGAATGIPFLNKLSELVQGDDTLPPEVKAQALEFYKLDLESQAKNDAEVSDRWRSDMTSDSWLSKNVRPMVLMFSWLLILIILFADYFGATELPTSYVSMFSTLFMTINAAYFGDRAIRGGITAFKKK